MSKMRQKIKDWFFLAKEDLKISQVLLKEKIYHAVCFHSQQAAEKAIKTYHLLRYPDALPGSLPEGLPQRKEAEKALKCAQEVFDFVKRKIKF